MLNKKVVKICLVHSVWIITEKKVENELVEVDFSGAIIAAREILLLHDIFYLKFAVIRTVPFSYKVNL